MRPALISTRDQKSRSGRGALMGAGRTHYSSAMRVMGFSVYPGELPFITVRSGKWQSRLRPGDYVQIQGEHGCPMPKTAAKVLDMREHRGPAPDHLADLYKGQILWAIALGPADLPPDELRRRFGFPV